MPNSTRRTAMIAVTAGVVFTAFLALTPRLTASETPEPDVAAVVSTTAPERAISEPVVSVSGADAFDGFDADPVEEEVGLEEWPDESGDEGLENENESVIDGSLTMTVEVLGPREGKEVVIIEDEDTVEWSLAVTNSGTEDLHGVFVYVEGAGPALCDTTYLAPGSTAQCNVTDEVRD
jgi:hypothetical protein